MSQEGWRTEFHKALVDALIASGSPLREDGDTHYGWIHSNHKAKRQMIKTVGIDYEASTYQEDSWDEFIGEGDTRVYGMKLSAVLLDGTVIPFRWSGTVSDLILNVVQGK